MACEARKTDLDMCFFVRMVILAMCFTREDGVQQVDAADWLR